MSNPINDGGPAFPHAEFAKDVVMEDGRPACRVYFASPGMTLRDYFAAHEGLEEFSGRGVPIELGIQLAGHPPSVPQEDDYVAWLKWQAKVRAALKYIRADAMIAEMERSSQ